MLQYKIQKDKNIPVSTTQSESSYINQVRSFDTGFAKLYVMGMMIPDENVCTQSNMVSP